MPEIDMSLDQGQDDSQNESKSITPETKTDSSVINNVDIKDLEKRIAERIRQEEKAKLYDTLEKVKKEKDDAEKKLREFETSKLTTEEQIQSQLKESNEKIQLLTQQLDQAKSVFEQELAKIASTAQNEVTSIKLEAEKEKLKGQYNNEIIDDLLVGNTIEELRANAEKAHNIYKDIKVKETARIQKELEEQKIGTGINPTNTIPDNKVGDVDLDNITDKSEWEKIRKSVLDKALRLQ